MKHVFPNSLSFFLPFFSQNADIFNQQTHKYIHVKNINKIKRIFSQFIADDIFSLFLIIK